MSELRTLDADRATALTLARRAILWRNDPDSETGPFLSMVEREVAEGSAAGAIRFEGDRAVGVALWERPTALGATLQVMFGIEAHQTPADYRAFLREVQSTAGPVLFAPGRLAGLTGDQESEVMESLGFARFSRSEMRFPPQSRTPDRATGPAGRLRDARPEDQPALARLHEQAYRGHFDRYLFLADPDPVRDAEIALRDIFGGRWGEFLPWASPVLDGESGLAAASLVVRAPYGPLIADVMVDPALQGRGLGRAVLVSTVRALRARDESVIVLNVTEGNSRAHGLYERLGFVRSLGPSHGWYSRAQIPVAPATT
ncbi:MAG: GNAT family N-acetyltransferase [Thermoplasmata archaeon]